MGGIRCFDPAPLCKLQPGSLQSPVRDQSESSILQTHVELTVRRLTLDFFQETMKQLTWLAAERRLCTDGDSEEEHSPTSTGSQEEEEEEDEEGPKGEESGEGRSSKESRDEETPTGERTPRGGGGKCPGRGRGQNRFVGPLQTPPGVGLTV